MELKEIMDELKSLGKERMKKIYMSSGAKLLVSTEKSWVIKMHFTKINYEKVVIL